MPVHWYKLRCSTWGFLQVNIDWLAKRKKTRSMHLKANFYLERNVSITSRGNFLSSFLHDKSVADPQNLKNLAFFPVSTGGAFFFSFLTRNAFFRSWRLNVAPLVQNLQSGTALGHESFHHEKGQINVRLLRTSKTWSITANELQSTLQRTMSLSRFTWLLYTL